ncbi:MULTISPECIES: Hsp20/alpha crystallin family protein [Gracilibacillus]|uniref:Hsp20/alpha crystallin family protein n=1 Tax=Gracilibacillus dipsosauri TaxID=178340 RepID=A0A317KTB7_9BACI|nr:Hsp20/alpha crystallin family protein [Gracilibacillus dipsosauri]PWU66695.1 Hsp20/alpha crystallin family protein [Gracilibacillus dipsosauri]
MDPFQQMHEWKNNMDQFFGGNFWNEFEHIIKPPIPAINLYELDNELIGYISLPGMENSKQIEVYVDEYVLEIRGQLSPIKQSGKMHHQEILQGDFSRKIDLPFAVRKDRVSANLRNGLMCIHLHKKMDNTRKRKRVNIENEEE